MNNYYDKKILYCTHCGHQWILLADRTINLEIYHLWLLKIWEQHKNLFPKGSIKDEKEN